MPKGKTLSYEKTIEAAWYVLKGFINPIDCNVRGTDDIPYYMNKNDAYLQFLTGKPVHLNYFSKNRAAHHFYGFDTYYYRSNYRYSPEAKVGKYYQGYGSSDNQALKLSFSDILSVKTKVIRDTFTNVILVGLDIDCHKGETDGSKLVDWLIKNYFPHSYYEPSTNKNGYHIYIKLMFPYCTPLGMIKDSLSELIQYLNVEKDKLGIKSVIDKPCGLPSFVYFVDHNSDNAQYFHKKYKIYDCMSANNFTVYLRRTQCIKIPRFNNSYEYCNLNDIYHFYYMNFYNISHIFELLSEFRKQDQSVQQSFSSGKKNDCQLDTIYTHTHIDTTECVPPPPRNTGSTFKSYDQQLKEIRGIDDSYMRKMRFYSAYRRYLKRYPSVDEAIDEYFAKGINRNCNRDNTKRKRTFTAIRQYMIQHKDKNDAVGLDLSAYDEKTYRELVLTRITMDEMRYKKDKKMKPIAAEDIALIYFAIEKSTEVDQMKVGYIVNSFSYRQARRILQSNGRGAHKSKIAKIFALLKEFGLIKKVGNFVPGRRGNCYVASLDAAQVVKHKKEAS